MSDLKKLNSDTIRSRIEKLAKAVNENFREICQLLTELHIRGEKHPMHSTYIYYREVASGSMHPMVSFLPGLSRSSRKLLAQLPMETQAELIEGRKIVVAAYGPDNRIVREEKTVLYVTDEQLGRALRDGKLRSFEAQKAELTKTQPRKHVSVAKDSFRLEADVKSREIIVGDIRLKLSDQRLAAALDLLGAKIVMKEKAEKQIA